MNKIGDNKAIRPVPDISDRENFRVVAHSPGIQTIRRDPVEPVPVGAIIGMIARVTGYDPDCDGSLMARLEFVDRFGEATGSDLDRVGLSQDCDVVLDHPAVLHELAEQ